jgi:hypothetical protein
MKTGPDAKVIKRIGCTGMVLVLLFLGYFICWRWLDFPFASRALEKEWTRAQKNGIPLTRDDLKPNPPLAVKDNAAPILRDIALKIVKDQEAPKNEPKTKEPSTPEAQADQAERAILARVEPYLAAITKASKMPGFFSDYDWDLGYELIFPELTGYKEMCKALGMRARLRNAKGDFAGAIQDIQTGFRLAQLVSQERLLLIGLLVSIAMYQIEAVAVETLAEQVSQDPAKLKRLRTVVLDPTTPPSDFQAALKSEMYNAVVVLRNIKRYGGSYRFMKSISNTSGDSDPMYVNKSIAIRRTGKPEGMIPRAFLARYLNYWNTVIESKAWKSPDLLNLGHAMDKLAEERSVQKTGQVSDFLNTILLPVFSGAGSAVVKAEAKKRTVHSLILVLEYNAKNHRFPKNLKEAGAEAEDPFIKGAPLHYKTDGKSVQIWSVGQDKKDDGGDRNQNEDVVSSYPVKKRK